ncbi:MAG: VCBS repeat-containing protein [Clostridia bacterium]|nr:VCBS repeat-containing protein [Clostridia bacterium]
MKTRITALVALLLAVSVLFSGCDAFSFSSAENLVRPPKLSGNDGQLQAAFETAVGATGEYVLKYPSAGDYRSAFVRYDCDGDGSDEAFVFYSLKTEEMSVHMYMLDFADGEWIPVDNFNGEGSDVYSIEFSDLNNDGIAEILVGWSSLDAKSNKKLSVYCSQKSGAELDYRVLIIETYTSMHTVDIDGDSQQELLIALINSTSDTYTTQAKLLKMSGSSASGLQISAVGHINLYSEITAFSSISSGYANGRTYIYIDEIAGDAYLTELLYWNSETGTLEAPVETDVLSIADCPTSRSLDIVCKDINSDGEKEIPSTALFPAGYIVRKNADGTDNKSLNENMYIINWLSYNEGEFSTVSSYIENTENKFRIEYDEEKMKDWSIVFYPDDGVSQFFVVRESDDPDVAEESVLMFTISVQDIESDVNINTYLASGTEYMYTYQITAEGEEMGITKGFISALFSVVN